MSYIAIDNKIQLRNLLLTDQLVNNNMETLNVALINVIPVEKNDGNDSIINFGDYVDFDGLLPVIKQKTPAVIKHFINAQFTNEINRKLKCQIGKVSIDDFSTDRAELIEAAREENDYNKFIQKLDFKRKFDYIKDKLDEIEEFVGTDVAKLVAYPTLCKATFMKQKLIPKNSRLEAGEPHRVLANSNIYKILELNNLKDDFIIFTDKDNQYYITNTVYNYPVIKKLNLDDFWRLSIGD